MITATDFQNIVSGRQRGVGTSLLRVALGLVEGPYSLGVRWRNWRYDRGRATIEVVDVPVISVGNLTLGGTGKTPMVEWLARWFGSHGVRASIVSRGYGAIDGGQNDEALELQQRLPNVPHLQNRDRVAGARVAIEELATQLVILDDGFQHRRLHRDLDIVLIDATEPFGYERVFPRGMLREPVGGLRRAHVIALTRADMVNQQRKQQILERLRTLNPDALLLELAHEPSAALTCDGQQHTLDKLTNQRIAAFCGIGNPQGFRHTLADCGYTVVDFREFPDHHNYTRQDVESLHQWIAGADDVEAVACTHKDLVKVGIDRLANVPLFAIAVEMRVLSGLDAVQTVLQSMADRAARVGVV